MKAIILYTSTGNGHSSAARAITEVLNNLGVRSKEVDSLTLAGAGITKAVSKAYSSIVKVSPKLFGILYYAGDKVGNSKKKSIIYKLNSLYADKVYKMLLEEKPDMIICTHLFCGQTITYIKNKHDISAVTSVIITDYTCSPLWEETCLDYYFIPHEDLAEEFVSKEILKEKLVPLGLPIKPEFESHIDKKEAKLNRLYDKEQFHILIIGGRIGTTKIFQTVYSLEKEISGVQITVVCGNNMKLFNKLKDTELNIRVLKYEDRLSELMDSADLVITKPGGLTSTEVMVKGIPVIIIYPIPGGEEANRNFFVDRDMAVFSNSYQETVWLCKQIISRKDISEKMITAQRKYISSKAGHKIAKFLIDKVIDRGVQL